MYTCATLTQPPHTDAFTVVHTAHRYHFAVKPRSTMVIVQHPNSTVSPFSAYINVDQTAEAVTVFVDGSESPSCNCSTTLFGPSLNFCCAPPVIFATLQCSFIWRIDVAVWCMLATVALFSIHICSIRLASRQEIQHLRS
ncbi:hypothetical protein Tcan_00613, partial [Toxocara canis]